MSRSKSKLHALEGNVSAQFDEARQASVAFTHLTQSRARPGYTRSGLWLLRVEPFLNLFLT
jgi:hypothetical protein